MAQLSADTSNTASSFNTVSRPRIFECSPTQNPCAQCAQPIERPIWSESGPDRMSFVWECAGCGYRFTTIAIFGHHDDHESGDHRIAA